MYKVKSLPQFNTTVNILHYENLLISRSIHDIISIWNINSNKLEAILRYEHDNERINVNPDNILLYNNKLILACVDHKIRIWDLDTFELINISASNLDEFSKYKPINKILIYKDILIITYLYNKISFKDLKTNTTLYTSHNTSLYVINMIIEKDELICYYSDHTIKIIDLNTYKSKTILNFIDKTVINMLVYENKLITNSYDYKSENKQIQVWNLENYELECEISANMINISTYKNYLLGYNHSTISMWNLNNYSQELNVLDNCKSNITGILRYENKIFYSNTDYIYVLNIPNLIRENFRIPGSKMIFYNSFVYVIDNTIEKEAITIYRYKTYYSNFYRELCEKYLLA